MTVRRERVLSLTLLLLILGVAAFLRFEHLGEPSYWLDEVLSDRLTTNALAQPWWRWLAGFENEHGPLSFAVQLATRLLGRDEFAGRFAAALLGLATIPLVWRITNNFAAAALLALSPLHVYYSREARPYALLMFLTAALIVTLLRDNRWFYAVLAAMLYTSAVAAPIVASAAVAAFLLGHRRFAIAAALTTPAFLLLYRGGPSSQPDAPFPQLDGEFFVRLAKGFTVSALGADIQGRTMLVLLALAVIGAVALWRRDRRTAIVILTMTLLPIALAMLSLKVFEHWFELRYVCASLIGFVILAGSAGVPAGWSGGVPPPRGSETLPVRGAETAPVQPARRRRSTALALLIVIAIAWQLWPTLRREPYQKLDWRRIASTIARYAKPGDLILAAEPSTGIVLPYYLAPYGRQRDVIQMSIAPLAGRMIYEYPATWLVSAGAREGPVRQWMCRYPVVLGSELDAFRMHYASPTGDFLSERAQAPEFRALDAAMGTHGFSLAMNDAAFRDGWASPEGGFRWATGTQSTIAVPRWGLRDRVIRVHVLPMDHPSLPRQTLRAAVNGHVLGEVTLANEWTEQTFDAPARVWINGLNTISFTFGRAAAPASIDPSTHDRRALAVNFDRIEVWDAATARHPERSEGSPSSRSFAVSAAQDDVRIASAFIDENTAWRNTPPRLPAAHGEAADALIGRLGFDPTLAGGRDLDDLATSLAAGSDCEDDRAWVARAYATLFQRAPTDPEMQSLLAKRSKGDSRATIVRHLMKSPELRAAVLGR